MGGSTDTAARTVAMYGDFGKEALDDLKDHYYRAFGYWSDEDFKNGNIYRWVDNAIAIAPREGQRRPAGLGAPAARRRSSTTSSSTTARTPRRASCSATASSTRRRAATPPTKKGAIETLQFMKEKGVLMALRHEKGETGELAKKAFHELMNPKVAQKEDLAKLEAERRPRPRRRQGQDDPDEAVNRRAAGLAHRVDSGGARARAPRGVLDLREPERGAATLAAEIDELIEARAADRARARPRSPSRRGWRTAKARATRSSRSAPQSTKRGFRSRRRSSRARTRRPRSRRTVASPRSASRPARRSRAP